MGDYSIRLLAKSNIIHGFWGFFATDPRAVLFGYDVTDTNLGSAQARMIFITLIIIAVIVGKLLPFGDIAQRHDPDAAERS